MSIYYNGKEYGATKVINYSASPDYNRGIVVDNIQSGNYVATDNGFLLIQLQSQQSNPTKVSVIRNTAPITDTGTEIASIVLSQYQYSETLTAQVMAREYYKLVIEGAGNPQVLSCMFYPYATTVPMKLTDNITMEQVQGLDSELDTKVDNTTFTNELKKKQNVGNYINRDALVTAKDATAITYVNFENTEVDVNTILKDGYYRCRKWINYPPQANNTKEGMLYNFNWNQNPTINSVGWGYQLYITTTGEIWRRHRNNSMYSDWFKVLTRNGVNEKAAGGTGRTDGVCTGIADNVIKTENNWSSDNTRGLSVTYWQTADFASKGLPTTAGALISNVFTPNLKSFMALNLSSTTPELRIRGSASDWKRVILDSDLRVANYANSSGNWTETRLANSTTLLTGYGTGEQVTPKTANGVFINNEDSWSYQGIIEE